MKRYYPNLALCWPSPKENRKFVKHNLNRMFNKCCITRRLRTTKTDLPYRSKLRSEYKARPQRIPCPEKRLDVWTLFCGFGYFKTSIRSPPRNESAMDLSPKRPKLDDSEPYQPMTPNTTPAKPIKLETVRSLTKVKRFDSLEIIEMSAGRYLNFGLANVIRQNSRGWSDGDLYLTVAVYVHKAPNAVGVKTARYLILLGRLLTTAPHRLHSTGSFLIGVYEGAFPDKDIANEILEPFVTEMLGIINYGLDEMCPPQITGDYSTPPFNGPVILRAFVVDPLAGSLITCTALPTARLGCSRCKVKGKVRFNNQLISFPCILDRKTLRADSDFDDCSDTKYHLAQPVINQLPIGLVTHVVLDYKYCCVAIMQRLWKVWTTRHLGYRINRASLKKIDKELRGFMSCVPVEAHPPLPTQEIDSWTPSHWREFVIYYGPVVLERFLPKPHFDHFICLHHSFRLMLSRDVLEPDSAFMLNNLIRRFVGDFKVLYGEDQVDHNVHWLLHYQDVTATFGNIEDYGGNDFNDEQLRSKFLDWDFSEEDNYCLESLQQAYMSANELESTGLINKTDVYLNLDRRLHYNGYLIGTKNPDNVVITKDGVARVFRIQQCTNGEITFLGQRYANSANVYESSLLNEKFVYLEASGEMEVIPLSEIEAKGFGFYTTSHGLCVMAICNV